MRISLYRIKSVGLSLIALCILSGCSLKLELHKLQESIFPSIENNPTYSGTLQLLAGSFGGTGYIDGSILVARFYRPNGIAVDGTGNLYVVDTNNFAIRKITSAGAVTTIAGTAGINGITDDPNGLNASFDSPQGIAVDSVGNLFVTDTNNYTIRKITSAGAVTTFAGLAWVQGSTDDANGLNARFNFPRGIAVDSLDNLYVSDTTNCTIRKITSAGAVTTFAGSPGVTGSTDDANGLNARFAEPRGLAVDSLDNLYVADTNNCTIRKITSAGAVTTFAGSPGVTGSTDDANGLNASFNCPEGISVDSLDNLYVTDMYNYTIRKITSAGAVTTFAGSPGVTGSTDDTNGLNARFGYPSGIAADDSGNLYVTDYYNNNVRKITSAGAVTTITGAPVNRGSTDDANGLIARFNDPSGIAADDAGNLYVADNQNHTIRKITPAGEVTTFAGSAGVTGSTNNANGLNARFNFPSGITADSAGNLYVVDAGNNTIRKITPAGAVTTFAGSPGVTGSTDNANGLNARFNFPSGITADSAGNLYVADTGNSLIRKISPAGAVTTIAAAAGFDSLKGITVDRSGILYVVDTNNHTIRKIDTGGTVTTIAGSVGSPGSIDDANGLNARFYSPNGITVDSAGNLYVTEDNKFTIRKITSAGAVTTLSYSYPFNSINVFGNQLFFTASQGLGYLQLSP